MKMRGKVTKNSYPFSLSYIAVHNNILTHLLTKLLVLIFDIIILAVKIVSHTDYRHCDLFQLAGPISIGETYDTTLVKFSRKEFSNLLSSDQEKPEAHQSSGLRCRGAHSRSNVVAPSASAKPVTPATVAWEDQQPDYARSANTNTW